MFSFRSNALCTANLRLPFVCNEKRLEMENYRSLLLLAIDLHQIYIVSYWFQLIDCRASSWNIDRLASNTKVTETSLVTITFNSPTSTVLSCRQDQATTVIYSWYELKLAPIRQIATKCVWLSVVHSTVESTVSNKVSTCPSHKCAFDRLVTRINHFKCSYVS